MPKKRREKTCKQGKAVCRNNLKLHTTVFFNTIITCI